MGRKYSLALKSLWRGILILKDHEIKSRVHARILLVWSRTIGIIEFVLKFLKEKSENKNMLGGLQKRKEQFMKWIKTSM